MALDYLQDLYTVKEIPTQGKTKTYELMYKRLWPKPIYFGPKKIYWLKSEVEAMINARIAGYSSEQTKKLVQSLEAKRKDFGSKAA